MQEQHLNEAAPARHVLVVVNRTAVSDELPEALARLANAHACVFTVLVPATLSDAGRDLARARLEVLITRCRGLGLIVDGRLADADPVAAVSDAWDPGGFDEIVVGTLQTGVSHWLQIDLPQRIAHLTGAPVTHVVCSLPSVAVPRTVPAPGGRGPELRPLLGPLEAAVGPWLKRATERGRQSRV